MMHGHIEIVVILITAYTVANCYISAFAIIIDQIIVGELN